MRVSADTWVSIIQLAKNRPSVILLIVMFLLDRVGPSGVPSPFAMRLTTTEGLELRADRLVSGPDSGSGCYWDAAIFWFLCTY